MVLCPTQCGSGFARGFVLGLPPSAGLNASTLDAFFEQNRDIMIEISSSTGDADGLQRICLGKDESKRLEQIDGVIANLKHYSAETKWEGKPNE